VTESASSDTNEITVWPREILPVLRHAVTVEYASVTRTGLPVMVPVTPYFNDETATVDVSTGLTYPAKAERARRNPKVALLFSDPIGSGLDAPPVVLVQGRATVRDSDLQANTDRYVRLTMTKVPDAYKRQPSFMLRRLNAYFARIWVSVTPTRVLWWPTAALDQEPREWVAPEGLVPPPSDPAPAGKQPPAWLPPPSDWRQAAAHSIQLPQRDLAWMGADGFALAAPVAEVEQVEDGFRVAVGPHGPGTPMGPATLTLHGHPDNFSGQENHTFVGEISPEGDAYRFRVDRLLADFSVAGNGLVKTVGFLSKMRRLNARTELEAARRGQPIPQVRLPGDR
jgi:hypothetical protein